MSFNNTKTPKKPTCKAKYQVPKRRNEKSGNPELYLTPELEEKFRSLYPVTMNRRMMELFGISHSTLHRFARELGLQKDETIIRRKLAKQIKKICEDNGYYDSMRGHRPSPQCQQAISDKFASGWHPMKAMKAKNPRKYKRVCAERREYRVNLIKAERRRVSIGLTQHTLLHIPQAKYTRRQTVCRNRAHRLGYIPGDMHEDSGQRWTIFYTDTTVRKPRFEATCARHNLNIGYLPKSGHVSANVQVMTSMQNQTVIFQE